MTIPNELVRTALEAALIVAIADRAHAPRPLHKFLNFQKMPAAAMPVVRKVLDSDEAFRQRVAESVNLDAVDRPSLLLLTRPDGWEEELERLADEEAQARDDSREAKAEKSAQRKLKAAEQAREKAEGRVQEVAAELDRTRAALEQERAAWRQAETTAHSLTWEIDKQRVRVRELEEATTRWQEERAELQRALGRRHRRRAPTSRWKSSTRAAWSKRSAERVQRCPHWNARSSRSRLSSQLRRRHRRHHAPVRNGGCARRSMLAAVRQHCRAVCTTPPTRRPVTSWR